MTDNKHPITPPPELVREWIAEWSLGDSWAQVCQNVALVAARWGNHPGSPDSSMQPQ